MIRELHQEIHTLYVTHHSWLLKWLKRRTNCTHHASDLAQDTFLRVIDNPQKLVNHAAPRALLSTIANGLMVDHIRRKQLEQAYLESIAHLSSDHLESHEYRMVLIESLMQFDALFYGLHANIRSVFLLSKLEGYTYPEIAKILGVSLRTVENHMAQALRHFLANA